ncbi:MAG: hypothetical protein A2Y33_12670 [Spirochaetes bacterium GWF1_51_8]|nr:MAG: hypothetical protein A2Y33_12670 [Spirochaetes bacterium GWF1_51_8]
MQFSNTNITIQLFFNMNTKITNVLSNDVDFSKPTGNPKGWWIQVIFGDILNWFHRNGLTPMWFLLLFSTIILLPLMIISHKSKNKKEFYIYLGTIILFFIISIFIQVKSYS